MSNKVTKIPETFKPNFSKVEPVDLKTFVEKNNTRKSRFNLFKCIAFFIRLILFFFKFFKDFRTT